MMNVLLNKILLSVFMAMPILAIFWFRKPVAFKVA